MLYVVLLSLHMASIFELISICELLSTRQTLMSLLAAKSHLQTQ